MKLSEKLYNKSQFSVVEIAFVILLITVAISYVSFDFYTSSKNYNLILETGLDSLMNDMTFRDLVIKEDIIDKSVNLDWSNIGTKLDSMLVKYELIIYDDVESQLIYSCEEINGKIYDERLVLVSSDNDFDFRKVRLGVCY